jgi:DNA-binding CsgD family transcriptional regulator
VSVPLRRPQPPSDEAEEAAMACTIHETDSAAEPLSGFGTGRSRLDDRGNAGPGSPMPAPRTAEDPTSAEKRPVPPPAGRPAGLLTDRDRELVGHLAGGRSTAQIAAAMSVSGNTARTRIRRISGKLAVTGRNELVSAARARGLL